MKTDPSLQLPSLALEVRSGLLLTIKSGALLHSTGLTAPQTSAFLSESQAFVARIHVPQFI